MFTSEQLHRLQAWNDQVVQLTSYAGQVIRVEFIADGAGAGRVAWSVPRILVPHHERPEIEPARNPTTRSICVARRRTVRSILSAAGATATNSKNAPASGASAIVSRSATGHGFIRSPNRTSQARSRQTTRTTGRRPASVIRRTIPTRFSGARSASQTLFAAAEQPAQQAAANFNDLVECAAVIVGVEQVGDARQAAGERLSSLAALALKHIRQVAFT